MPICTLLLTLSMSGCAAPLIKSLPHAMVPAPDKEAMRPEDPVAEWHQMLARKKVQTSDQKQTPNSPDSAPK